MRIRRTPVVAMMMVLALGGVASAQTSIGPSITQADSLTNAQLTQITEFVRDHQDDLLSEDPVACQRARKRLSDPLEGSNISLRFRREYSNQLMGPIGIASQSANEHVAVNSLLLAGRIATPESVEVLVRALEDERVPVRYAGLAGLTLTMAQIDRSQPAIFEDGVIDLIEQVATVVQNDDSSIVVDGGVRALVAAAAQRQISPVQRRAQVLLFESLRHRLKNHTDPVDAQLLAATMRALSTLRGVLIADITNGESATARQAAELSGHVLALLSERIDSGDFDGDPEDPERMRIRDLTVQALQLSEATIGLVQTDYLGGQPLAAPDLDGAFANGDDADVADAIEQGFIGRDGVLIRPPFSFAPNTFDR